MAKTAIVPESRLSSQITTNDNAAANREEVEEQIEELSVKKAARENATGAPVSMIRDSKEMEAVNDAVAAGEETQEQVERKRVEKKAFENRISAAPAGQRIRNGGIRE